MLVLVFCLACVAFAVAGNYLVSNHLARMTEAQDGAQRLAESVVHLAAARIMENPALAPTDLPDLEMTLAAFPGGTGKLALEKSRADALGLKLSVNNLLGRVRQAGWGGTVVEPETASLVGTGNFAGKTCQVEVVLHVPAFPYVVASSVPLASNDGLGVFGIASPTALQNGFSQIPADQITPGHLATNAEDPSSSVRALELKGSGTHVEGDAQAHGQVRLTDGAAVNGEVKNNSDVVDLPKIDVHQFDPIGKEGLSELSSANLGATTLSGFQRRSGNLNVSGGLKLSGGVLYVDGDLTVTGGVTGKGAIIATGKVTVQGGAALDGDNQTAILAQGDLTLAGTPSSSAEFRGLIYTQGNLDSRYTNIAGAVVVNNPDSSGSAYLEHTNLAQSDQLARVQFDVTSGGGSSSLTVFAPAPFSDAVMTPGAIDIADSGYNFWLDMGKLQVDANGNLILPPDNADPLDYLVFGYSSRFPDPPAPTDRVAAGPAAMQSLYYEMALQKDIDYAASQGRTWNETPELKAQREAKVTTALEGLRRAQSAVAPNTGKTYFQDGVALAAQVYGLGAATNPTTTTTTTAPQTTTWKIDLSQFSKISERVRVRSWRVL